MRERCMRAMYFLRLTYVFSIHFRLITIFVVTYIYAKKVVGLLNKEYVLHTKKYLIMSSFIYSDE